jgi:hypothetical protein
MGTQEPADSFLDEDIRWELNDASIQNEVLQSAIIPGFKASLQRVVFKEGSFLFFERFVRSSEPIFSLGDLVLSYKDQSPSGVLMVVGGLRIEKLTKKRRQESSSHILVLVADINNSSEDGQIYRFVLDDAFKFQVLFKGPTTTQAWSRIMNYWYGFISKPEKRKESTMPSELPLKTYFKSCC